MANTDAPNGFTPAYHLYGGTIRPQKLRIASGTSAAIFNGDVVNLSSGYVIQGTATGTPAGVLLDVSIPQPTVHLHTLRSSLLQQLRWDQQTSKRMYIPTQQSCTKLNLLPALQP